MHYLKKPEWSIPEREATPESVFLDRRKFLAGSLGVVAGGSWARTASRGPRRPRPSRPKT